jgi:hypothetical protein
MRHIPYGVDRPPGAVRPVPVGGQGCVTFGFFGSVNPQKGLEILISAFRQHKAEAFRLVVRGNMQHFPKYAKRVRASPRPIRASPSSGFTVGELCGAVRDRRAGRALGLVRHALRRARAFRAGGLSLRPGRAVGSCSTGATATFRAGDPP